MTGGTAGVPGGYPDGWQGVQREIVGGGERNGMPTLKLRFYGAWDEGADGYTNIAMCSTGALAVTESEQLSFGMHAALIAGSIEPLTSLNVNTYYRLAGAYKGQASLGLSSLTSDFEQYSKIDTALAPIGGSCDAVDSYIHFSAPLETPFDFTLEIGAPYLSPVAFIPPIIIGSGTTTTRAVDNPLVVQGVGSVPWPDYDVDAGATLRLVLEPSDMAGIEAFRFLDGTSDNYLTVRRGASDGVEVECHSGGVEVFSDESATDFPTSLATLELYMEQDATVTVSLDGTVLSDITQTGATLPDFTQLSLACVNGTTTVKQVYGK